MLFNAIIYLLAYAKNAVIPPIATIKKPDVNITLFLSLLLLATALERTFSLCIGIFIPFPPRCLFLWVRRFISILSSNNLHFRSVTAIPVAIAIPAAIITPSPIYTGNISVVELCCLWELCGLWDVWCLRDKARDGGRYSGELVGLVDLVNLEGE